MIDVVRIMLVFLPIAILIGLVPFLFLKIAKNASTDRYDSSGLSKEIAKSAVSRRFSCKDEPLLYKCFGHPNRTLALRYGILNQSKLSGEVRENDTIRLLKMGYVDGFEGRGHYWAELVDFNNAKVRVVIEDGADFVNTFYPASDREWFEKYKALEQILKNAEAFTLKELAKYHLDLVVVPRLLNNKKEIIDSQKEVSKCN
ncbi:MULTISPECIES: hypothetical protein [unclassified Oleiphilus]|uniref:hypothetical protein n=1 Tax=unclassified Oleiphilus TaxID=2631174 RepID=UPI0007C389B8|nr:MULTISPECIES: hypothetical protein [unclassified Oleiphilus]KZY79077.1 hypothetical protein A3741_07495 [Oleiphilus sp. HI0069]KZZ34225.1 hypothetical protein A3755_06345 [Oleiphilus sp. HI0085]KZZ35448.1 hypothetical protein A3756_15645 [Oleiphilus sp. HI0086]KZZ38197.1 hypothetical protein A3757_08345 [Oleiphilus sp. HI0117]KZZ55382.1 hypothetical protein A3761_11885 [Oleiphilus sp. HI0123]